MGFTPNTNDALNSQEHERHEARCVCAGRELLAAGIQSVQGSVEGNRSDFIELSCSNCDAHESSATCTVIQSTDDCCSYR